MALSNGTVEAGFEGVREAFELNFAQGLEVGSAFSAWRDGRKVVDLWGGLADRDRHIPWQSDSLQLIFSGSKGLTAICMLMLIDRGLIELDAPVCRYWPAFGKAEISVAHILSHTAGLPGLVEPTSWNEMLDPDLMARRLELQVPFADPRAALVYHPVTYGWLCGELLRQVDGRTLGRFFSEEIALPLELDIWFGLPSEQERRVTTLTGDSGWGRANKNLIIPDQQQRDRDALQTATWYNPPLFGPDPAQWNSRALHRTEMPGANAIGTARSIAKLYAVLATGGGALLRPQTIALGTRTIAEGLDVLNDDPRHFGAGLCLQIAATMQFGPPLDGFGHGGAGGSVHGAWPSSGVGFSYVMNLLTEDDDIRATRLLAALAEAIS